MEKETLPATIEFGLLPPGVHDATLDGIERQFGSFQSSDRRIRLYAKLKDFAKEVATAAPGAVLVVDGSFVMGGVDNPDDIDLIMVMPDGWDFTSELRPSQYNIASRRMVKRKYGFDLLVVRANSVEMDMWIEFFSRVNVKWFAKLAIPVGTRKGLVRIRL